VFNKFIGKISKFTEKAKKEENKIVRENLKYSQSITYTGSWTHDLIKDRIFLSEEVYRVLGTSPLEFDGKLENFHKFIHPDDLDEVKEATIAALTGKEYDIEYRILSPDGKVKFVHEKTKAILDKDLKPIKMVGVIRDITKEKLLKNCLMELSYNLNEAQRVSGVGSWKYDLIKDEFFGSDELYRVLGVDIKDYSNDFESMLKLIHPNDRIKISEALDLYYKGKCVENIFRIMQPDGLVKYVQEKGEPVFDEKGKVIAIQGTLQDITKIKLLEMKLEKNNKLLNRTEALTQMGSWEWDLLQDIYYCSDEVYRILGIKKQEEINILKVFIKCADSKDVKIIEDYINNPSRTPFDIELFITRPDGIERCVSLRMEFVFKEENQPLYLYGMMQDITEKKELQKEIEKQQQEIQKQQKKFQILIEKSKDVFEIISPDGTITYISESCEKVIGMVPEERIGKNVYDFYTQEYQLKIKHLINQIIQFPDKPAQDILVIKTPSGKEVHLEVNMQNFLDEPIIKGIVINFRDVTKRIKMERKLHCINNRDEITGLPNRIHFNKHLSNLWKEKVKKQEKFALMILGLFGLDDIIYNLGYETHISLLKRIVKRLREFLGDGIYISRYTDGYFAIIIDKQMTYGNYDKIAKGILDLMMESFLVNSYELNVSANLGICVYSDQTQNVDILKKQVFAALLRAIKEGRNIYKFYSSDFDIQNYKEFVIRRDLLKSIGNHQLKIYYQPMVDLKTNDILAAEVLIRWEHPEWGIISPKEFIAIAEETGYIIKIGDWLIEEVCKTYRQWMMEDWLEIKISINYSSIQFFKNDFVDKIINVIQRYHLNPHFLIVEITESIFLSKVEKVVNDIKKLQSYGIQVALDDFGTGYSSLAYLNSLSIDIIKIDGSFIKNINTDLTSSIIVKGIVNITKELKIKIVAECIENWEQLSLLKSLNCHTGQGYIYSKPLPREDFERVLAKGRCKPVVVNHLQIEPREERRKFFRIEFNQLLETSMTIKELNGKRLDVGNTKVLVKNLGPGGLCFISHIKFPLQKSIVLKFKTNLLNQELYVSGTPVWTEEYDYDLYVYGIQLMIEENDRKDLIRFLNQVQIKTKNNLLFDEGSFITEHPGNFFKGIIYN
jgi:PAS domain S-box-containing protein/diguanylate cyclase (GGDEF)-like protein